MLRRPILCERVCKHDVTYNMHNKPGPEIAYDLRRRQHVRDRVKGIGNGGLHRIVLSIPLAGISFPFKMCLRGLIHFQPSVSPDFRYQLERPGTAEKIVQMTTLETTKGAYKKMTGSVSHEVFKGSISNAAFMAVGLLPGPF